MKKTTVYLDEADFARLKAMAQRERKPSAELIRHAVSLLVATQEPALPEGASAFRSGRSDVSTSHKQILKEAARRREF